MQALAQFVERGAFGDFADFSQQVVGQRHAGRRGALGVKSPNGSALTGYARASRVSRQIGRLARVFVIAFARNQLGDMGGIPARITFDSVDCHRERPRNEAMDTCRFTAD